MDAPDYMTHRGTCDRCEVRNVLVLHLGYNTQPQRDYRLCEACTSEVLFSDWIPTDWRDGFGGKRIVILEAYPVFDEHGEETGEYIERRTLTFYPKGLLGNAQLVVQEYDQDTSEHLGVDVMLHKDSVSLTDEQELFFFRHMVIRHAEPQRSGKGDEL